MSIRQSYFVSFLALLIVAALLPLEAQACRVEILEPDENDVHLKCDEINWQAKFYPTDTPPEDISWNFFYTQGSGTPSSGSGTQVADTREFHSTVTSEGTVKLKVQATVCATTYEDERTIETVVPQVIEIDFIGGDNHQIYDVGSEAEFKRSSGRNEPACYTKDGDVTITAKFEADENLTSSCSVLIDADDGSGSPICYDAVGATWQNWPSGASTLNGSGSNELLNIIKAYAGDFSMNWRYKVQKEGCSWITMNNPTTNHTLYQIYDSPNCPADKFIKEYIANAVGWGSDQSTESDIATEVKENINGTITSGCICSESFDDIWKAARGDNNQGMCCCRATGMSQAMAVLGVDGYTTIVYVNERPEPGVKDENPSTPKYCSVCKKYCYRCAWWGDFWNNWEGACRSHGTGSTCYAPAGNFEGTYNEIRDVFGNPWEWTWGGIETNTCPHLSYP